MDLKCYHSFIISVLVQTQQTTPLSVYFCIPEDIFIIVNLKFQESVKHNV